MTYKPKKQLGQNFIADKMVLSKIVDAAEISKDDVVLEIGPGQGSLTYALCQKAKRVVAVEKDEKLFEYLKNKLGGLKNLELVSGDILEFDFNKLEKDYKIVANIPYYLTSFLLRKIFSLENKPSEIILMVQKEVAERISSKSGKMNLLAISVQIFSEPEILFYVSKNSFWPKPKVDSAVIRIIPHPSRLFVGSSSPKNRRGLAKKADQELVDGFFNLVKIGFTAKRKLLANNLAKGLGISKEKIYDIFKVVGIDVKARAQDLSVEDWMEIYSRIQMSKL